MLKVFLYIIIALPVLYLGMLLGFYLMQDYLIFRGTRLADDYKYQFQWPFEERFFTNREGIRLNAIHFRVDKPKGVIFYHHGNSGDLQSWGQRAGVFLSLRYDVFMYDYRGYGKSGGSIRQEHQLHRDAAFLYKQLVREYSPREIVIFGISLGTGISCKLAARYSSKSLILETPYYHFFDVIKYHYPFLPVKLISKYKFRTNYFIRKVKCPVYVVHGMDDEMISVQSSLRLKKKFPHIQLSIIEGGRHSNLQEFLTYRHAIEEALR